MIQIDGSKLFMDKTYADVTFEVDGQEIPGHRLILSQACAYFEKLLYGDFDESKSKRVQITGTSAKVFKEVIRFIYLKQLDIEKWEIGDLLALLSVAHEYQFLPLFSQVTKVLEHQTLDFDSCISVASAASVYESNTLKAMCDSFVSMKIDDFICNNDLEKFTAEFICSMFESPKISTIDQDKLLGAIYKWQQNNSVNRITSVFSKIGWEKVSPKITAMILKEFISAAQNADEWKFWKQMATVIEEPLKCMARGDSEIEESSDLIAKVDTLVALKSHKFKFSSQNCEATLFCGLFWDQLVFSFRKNNSFVEISVKRMEFESLVHLEIKDVLGIRLNGEAIRMPFYELLSNDKWFKYTMYTPIAYQANPIVSITVVVENIEAMDEIKLQNIVIE